MSSPVAALASLERLDVDVLSSSELAIAVESAQRVRAWLDAFDVSVARRASVLAAAGSSTCASDVLAASGRRRSRDACAAVRRAEVCEQIPELLDALGAGQLSSGHVDAVARAAADLSGPGLAELTALGESLVTAAATQSVEAFERECRDLVRLMVADEGESRLEALRRQRKVARWIDRQSGLHHTMLVLDPEADAKVATALHAATSAQRSGLTDPNISWDHVQADALVGLITGARSVDRRVPEVSVLVDLQTLRGALHDRSVSETSSGVALPPSTIRRLACEADLLPVVLGASGDVLDVGRARRLATAAQRRAIRAMHRTCVMPGCAIDVEQCRIHHVDPFALGGRTDLDRLVPVCELDHHRLHEGGWRLEIRPDRVITITRPDGVVVHHGASVDRTHGPPPRAPAA